MGSNQDRKEEELELEGDSLCKAIDMSFGIRDTHDPVHDSVGGEDQIVDAEQDIANAQNNTPGLVEEPSSDEENDVLVPDFGDIVFAEELGTPNFVNLSTMAFTEDNRNLLFLANVALGAHSQAGQQPAPVVPPRAIFGGNTLRQSEQPVISAPDGLAVARDPGFTPINRRPRPRTLPHPPPSQLTRPLLQPPPAPTPILPMPSRNQRVKRSRKGKTSRTTGFNRETGEGMLTSACGNKTPQIKKPVVGGGGKGEYRCPRCLGQFTRPRNVKDHFVSCVRKHGNPQGFHWFDHSTLAATKKWLHNRLAEAKKKERVGREEGTDELEGEEEEEEEDEEGEESNLQEVNEDESRAYNVSTRSEIRDHGSTRYQIPPFSPRERSGPEPPRYRPLSYGYGPQLNASPYDPIVPEYPTPSFGQGFRPDSYRNPPLGYGSGPQVNVSPYDPIVPSYPTLSFGQGFRPEASRYPPLESGYRPRVQTSPYDPIVPGNRNPVRRGERAAEEDDNEDETPSVLRNTKRPRRRPQTD